MIAIQAAAGGARSGNAKLAADTQGANADAAGVGGREHTAKAITLADDRGRAGRRPTTGHHLDVQDRDDAVVVDIQLRGIGRRRRSRIIGLRLRGLRRHQSCFGHHRKPCNDQKHHYDSVRCAELSSKAS